MINEKDQEKILKLTLDFWQKEANAPAFRSIFVGKEIGHRIADYVDEKTSELLIRHMMAGFLRSKKGKKLDRSMGDIWIKSSGIFNPLNVKAGEYSEKGGQPNLVALNKVLTALLKNQIDSYYLLIIKMQVTRLSKNSEDVDVSPKVYLVDMLDHLDVVHFNSGPGQLMLKERLFYQKMNTHAPLGNLHLSQKIERLVEIKIEGDKQLFEDRKRVSEKLKLLASEYEKKVDKAIDQKGLRIG
jgi:hypothetical protein